MLLCYQYTLLPLLLVDTAGTLLVEVNRLLRAVLSFCFFFARLLLIVSFLWLVLVRTNIPGDKNIYIEIRIPNKIELSDSSVTLVDTGGRCCIFEKYEWKTEKTSAVPWYIVRSKISSKLICGVYIPGILVVYTYTSKYVFIYTWCCIIPPHFISIRRESTRQERGEILSR